MNKTLGTHCAPMAAYNTLGWLVLYDVLVQSRWAILCFTGGSACTVTYFLKEELRHRDTHFIQSISKTSSCNKEMWDINVPFSRLLNYQPHFRCFQSLSNFSTYILFQFEYLIWENMLPESFCLLLYTSMVVF